MNASITHLNLMLLPYNPTLLSIQYQNKIICRKRDEDDVHDDNNYGEQIRDGRMKKLVTS